MAKITGVGGQVIFAAGYVTNIKSWTISAGADEFDVTDFTSVGWKNWLLGLTEWEGTYEGWVDTAIQLDAVATYFAGAPAAATFDIDGTRTFTGEIMVKGFAVDTSVSDPVTVTFTYRGEDALTVN